MADTLHILCLNDDTDSMLRHNSLDASDESTAVGLVRQAVDGGITFFDNCWEYHRGKSEAWMGAG